MTRQSQIKDNVFGKEFANFICEKCDKKGEFLNGAYVCA
jgi:hypothetical protein